MVKVEHDGDGKLYYIDSSGKLKWIVEVEIFEGDTVRDAINSFIKEIFNGDNLESDDRNERN